MNVARWIGWGFLLSILLLAVVSPTLARPKVRNATAKARRTFAAQTVTPQLVNESFAGAVTQPYLWGFASDTCLTAGDSTSPASSLAPCLSEATHDKNGAGALQLTQPNYGHKGLVVFTTPLTTSFGLQVVFTDYAFNGTTPGADGAALFLTDASQPMPSTAGDPAGGLGYVNLPNAYLGVGLDEFGSFSSSDEQGGTANGFPGREPESIGLRGAAASSYQYLGGTTNAQNQAASLPFSLDQPSATSRPTNAPTIRFTLTAAGEAIVEIDRHDGNGFLTYVDKTIVGLNGQPALPARVYLGFSAGTGGYYNRHQIGSVTAAYLAPGAAIPFVPTSISNLTAWYDASDSSTITQASGSVSAWKDKSGSGNAVAQPSPSAMPKSGSTIDGLGALNFAQSQYLVGANGSFSSNLLNESTVFVVTNQRGTTQNTSVVSSGPTNVSSPRWELRLSESGQTHFDFNNKNAGRLVASEVPTGPAIWTAAGSVSGSAQYLRKDGNTLATSTGPGGSASGQYPLVIGANLTSGAPSYEWHGLLGEVLVYNRFLSTAETADVEGYLACKWGLQNRLPANHPYRRTCPGGTAAAAPLPLPTPSPSALPDPPQVYSKNGQIALTVTAQADPSGNPQLVYNGSAAPPTLRLLPGDILSVTLVNSLPTPPSGAGYLNDTNLHFHGLHVSPNAPADDSIDLIAVPGQTIHYKISIPVNHPPGLYWYHSHAHGEAERQNLAGMSGALVIDGIAQYAPLVQNLPERILIVRDAIEPGQALPNADRRQVAAMAWAMAHAAGNSGRIHMTGPGASMTMGDAIAVRGRTNASTRNPYVVLDPNYRKLDRRRFDSSDGHCVGTETAVKAWTLNGVSQPSIGIRPGEQQFWRLVNAGSDTYLDVAVDNASLQLVALDGVPLSSGVNTPATLTVSHYVVPPASRVEFIVTGPPAGTTAYLRTNCFDAGAAGPAMPAAILASIDPTHSLSDFSRHRQRFAPKLVRYRFPAVVHTFYGTTRTAAARILAQTVARTQTLTYSDQNTINGVAYDPGAAAQFYAQSGTIEEWTIVNNSSQVHTFHIHQIHFVVEAINGVAQAQEYVMDNVNVPAASANGPGSVKILLDFTDPAIIGTFLLHCHILAHEDGGMMAKIRVGTAPPLTTNPAQMTFASPSAASQSASISGGAAPYSVSGCGGVASAALSGSTLNVSPVAAGSCVLTIADSSGLTATLSISVTAPASPVMVSPNSLSFMGPNAAAQNASVSGGTPPYSVSGCSGVASAAINSSQNGVSVSPIAVGTCSLTISDSASNMASVSVAVNAVSNGNPGDNVTFHHDAGRTGWDTSETTLTTTNVAGSSFGLLGTISAPSGMPAFGKVYAQPLYATSEKTADGQTHNLVLIATATDQVYAVDDRSGAVVWERNFTNPSAGITQQSWSDTNCSDVTPDVGITATPVIDRAADRVYVVVATKENGVFHQRLHALSLASGADAVSAVEVTATVTLASGGTATVDPEWNFSRSALLDANGNIYVALGSHCDFHSSSLHGWLLAFNASTLQFAGNAVDTTNLNTGSNYFLGSIWMSGFGPAADTSGNVYFATGNGPYDGVNNFGMSVLKLPGNLDITKANYFTPYGEAADSAADADLGAGGVMLLPDISASTPHVLVQGGKCGAGSSNGGTQGCVKYLLNRDSLGGFQSGDVGALWHADTGGGMFGGPAYFSDSNGIPYVVYGGGNNFATYKVNVSPVSLTSESSANVGCLECRDGGSQPVVSSNGTVAGTAVVWALQTPGSSGGTISLRAFDALHINTTLFLGAAGSWTETSGASHIGGALVSPLVANGRVYVPTDGAVAVFGLSQ